MPEIAEALEEEEVRVERIVKLLEEYLAFGVKQLKTAVLRRNTLKNLPFSQKYTPEFCLLLPIDFFLLQCYNGSHLEENIARRCRGG